MTILGFTCSPPVALPPVLYSSMLGYESFLMPSVTANSMCDDGAGRLSPKSPVFSRTGDHSDIYLSLFSLLYEVADKN